MRTVVIEPPEPVVSIEEARRQIIDLPAEDEAYVASLIMAATAWIDGPAGWLGRCIGKQTLELIGWIGCSRLKLPYPPLVSITSVYTETETGTQTLVTADQYRLSHGEMIIAAGASWVTQPVHRVRYVAGYDVAPAPIKVAILMLVAQWYRTRMPIAIGASVEALPFAVEALLSPYRVYS